MATLKKPVIKDEALKNTKANGRVEQRTMTIEGKSMMVKIYSLRNPQFGAFELIVPARSGVTVQPNQEVEIINPSLHSVGRVNSSQYTSSSGRRETDYVGFVERSVFADGLKMKGEK
ncbi:hypothetical protein [Enterococcus sp. LJL51]|uniref:hypothetical protein n=1 Tax=Enterococcus sp. LJL51 TaxID=3416656 RepID=UPI003CF053DC